MKKLAFILMEEQYPFGHHQQIPTSQLKIVVYKRLNGDSIKKQQMRQKIQILEDFNFKKSCLINIESIIEEETSLRIFYEYIPIKIDLWVLNINENIIEQIKKQLRELSQFLAAKSILTELKMENIGMNEHYQTKYYLQLDYQINLNLSEDSLKKIYNQQIDRIFGNNLQKSMAKQRLRQSKIYIPEDVFYDSDKDMESSQTHFQSRKVQKLTNFIKHNFQQHHEKQMKVFSKSNSAACGSRPPSLTLIRSSEGKMAKTLKINKNVEKHENQQIQNFSTFSSNNMKIQYMSPNYLTLPFNPLNSDRDRRRSNISHDKIQSFKKQEYRNIICSNKDFLQDFVLVLEDDDDVSDKQPHRKPPQTQRMRSLTINTAEQLKNRANQAINNTHLLIKKLRQRKGLT